VEEKSILRERQMFAEMLHNSDEKIFLEAIDQFFEQESSINYIEKEDFVNFDLEIEKMNDKFYDSLDEDICCGNATNLSKDISTEFDSEDASSQSSLFLPKKKFFLHDLLIINQENINKTKKKVLEDYCSKLQMIEKFRNVWREKEM
jgi:hypothetical protein